MKFQKQQTPWNKGKKLHYPIWNKGKKGIHLSPDTEFKKGSRGFTGKHSEESKLKMSLASKGRIMSDESRKKISLALKGKTPKNIVAGWNKGMKMPPMSEETRLKYSLVQKERVKLGLNNLLNGDGAKGWNKGIKLPQITGDKHWNWQGGISPERQKNMIIVVSFAKSVGRELKLITLNLLHGSLIYVLTFLMAKRFVLIVINGKRVWI